MDFSVKYRSFNYFLVLHKTFFHFFEHRKNSEMGNCGCQPFVYQLNLNRLG